MLKVRLQVEKNPQRKGPVDESLVNNRRGRFIVLGSSGECLPVTRYPLKVQKSLSSASSSEDDFHSAKSSLDDGRCFRFHLPGTLFHALEFQGAKTIITTKGTALIWKRPKEGTHLLSDYGRPWRRKTPLATQQAQVKKRVMQLEFQLQGQAWETVI